MGEQFINPYNFIPLNNERAVASAEEKGNLTGRIIYRLRTVTPLFIPASDNLKESEAGDDSLRDQENKSDTYEFYSYGNAKRNPVIPGSELRGMLRNIYETLTNSCMGVFNSEIHPVKRTMEVFEPGLIHKKQKGLFELVKARDLIYNTGKRPDERKEYRETEYHEGQILYFEEGHKKIESASDQKNEQYSLYGWLIKGMEGPEQKNKIKEKHNAHILVPENAQSIKLADDFPVDITEYDIGRLLEVIRDYQSRPGQEAWYEEYKDNLERFLESGKAEEGDYDINYFPVYYSLIKDEMKSLLYMSPARYTKELSHNSLGDLAKDFVPCKKKENCCPTCQLFGMTGESEKESIASKIRICDAKICNPPEKSEKLFDIITLNALMEPRLSNTEFYLKKPEDADFWTYDYVIRNGEISIDRNEIQLRGRKYYWHQQEVKEFKGETASDFNKKIFSLKKGQEFTGEVYFKNITELQLKQLVWILNSGSENFDKTKNPTTGYKLGGAKSYGFGSVTLHIDQIWIRTLGMDDKEEIIYNQDQKIFEYGNTLLNSNAIINANYPKYDDIHFEEKCKQDFLQICSLEATKGKTVSYALTAYGQEDQKGYEWFGLNRKYYGVKSIKENGREKSVPDKNKFSQAPRKRIQTHIVEHLPYLGKESLELPCKIDVNIPLTENTGGIDNGYLITGNVYDVIITGFNKKKTSIHIKCGDIEGAIYYKEMPNAIIGEVDKLYERGERIKAVYIGFKDSKYHNFTLKAPALSLNQ